METLLSPLGAGPGPERPARRCGNCRALLEGPYCARCGQRDVDLNVTARSLLTEGLQEFIAVDRRFLRTVHLLFARPGHLTRTYLAGKRVRYTSPLRLYLAASVLFFSAYVLTQGVREGYMDARNPQLVNRVRAMEARESGGSPPLVERRSLLAGVRDFRATLASGQRRAILDRTTFVREYSENLSWALLLTLPVLSLVLGLVHLGSGRLLIRHLVFSLHFGAVFAFGFLALMIAGVLAKVGIRALGVDALALPDVNLLLYVPGGVALLVYLYVSTGRVYPERARIRVVRFALTAVSVTASLLLAFLAASMYTMLRLG